MKFKLVENITQNSHYSEVDIPSADYDIDVEKYRDYLEPQLNLSLPEEWDIVDHLRNFYSIRQLAEILVDNDMLSPDILNDDYPWEIDDDVLDTLRQMSLDNYNGIPEFRSIINTTIIPNVDEYISEKERYEKYGPEVYYGATPRD